MDATPYYYYYYYDPNSIYNYSTQPFSYETYQTVNEGQVGEYNGPNLYEEQLQTNEREDDTFKDPDAIPLPKDLTVMFKPLECELCGVQVTSETSAYTHYEGKTHIKNVNAYMKEHYNVYGSLKLKKERFIPIKCDVCNIELTSKVVYQQHFSGKQHQKNLRKIQYNLPAASIADIFTGGVDSSLQDLPPPPPPPVLSDFVCVICNITTNTQQQLNLHKSGQKHTKRMNKLKESKLDNAINAFYNGEWAEGFENGVYTADTAEEDYTSETATSFIENPDMDYPLQFNDSLNEPSDHEKTTTTSKEAGDESGDNLIAPTLMLAESNILQTSLAENTIDIDLDINDGKLLSSTGVFLRQLTLVSQTMKNKNKIDSDSSHDFGNNTESVSTSEKDSADQFKSVEEPNYISPINTSTENVKISNSTIEQTVIEKKPEDLINSNAQANDFEKVNISAGNEQTNENVPLSSSDKDNNGKKDSQLDQEITKLAIEEIEKESTNFEKIRSCNKLFIPKDVPTKSDDQLINTTKCKYDKAGYRINEEIGISKNKSNNNKENDYESNRKRNAQNITSYNNNNRWYGNRNYNYQYRYNNNRRNNNNYGIYNKYDQSYWNRYSERNSDYKTKNSRDHEKRKRDRNYSSDEERSRSHKSQRRSYKDDNYKDKKHRSRSRSRKRRRSSRNRKHRHSSSESSYSERSRSNSSDKETSRKTKSKQKNERRNKDGKTNGKRKEYERVKRNKRDSSYSDSESATSSSSRNSRKSSNCHDSNKLDKDGWCEKQHKCPNAYNKCRYKHKEPFKIKTEKMEPTEIVEKEVEKKSWNPEAPTTENNSEVTSTTQIKVEKDEHCNDTKLMIDPALLAYMTTAGTYYCKYCIVSTRSNELFREHLQTPKHALLMKFKNKMNYP